MNLRTTQAMLNKSLAGPQRLLRVALVLSLLIVAGGAWWCLADLESCSLTSFMLTADQQGRQLYRQGKYPEAAQTFMNQEWRAAALYRAGEFETVAGLYTGMTKAETAYNFGNALVMQGKYEEAVAEYDRALSLRPGWQAAEANREIAAIRAGRLEKKGGDMTGGQLGADEISFEKGKANTEETEQVAGPQVQSEAEMRAIWLRQVQTKPADFLKAKFAYQAAMKKNP